jgi:tRNA dimethylallyltransferase
MTKDYNPDLPSMSGIGYKQIGMFIQGKLDLTIATQQIKNETHRFARHQYAWFHLNDARIHWLNEYDDMQKEAHNLVASFLTGIRDKQVNHELH